MKKFKYFIVVIIATLMLSSCSIRQPIRIGFVAGLSAPDSDLGLSGMRGALLAVEQVNNSGGVLGRKLELVIKNDGNDPVTAVKVDQEFLDEKVGIIVGHMISGIAKQVISFADENDMLIISPTIAAESLSGIDDNFIRMIPSNLTQAETISRIFSKNEVTKIAVVLTNGNKVFGEQIVNRLRELEPSIVIDSYFSNDISENSTDQVVDKIVQGNYDGVALLLAAEQVARYAQKFMLKAYHPTVVLPAWAQTSSLHRLGGKAVEGFFIVNYTDLEKQIGSDVHFESKFYDYFGEQPNFASVLTYDAVLLTADAINQAGTTDPLKVKQQMLKKSLKSGVDGNFYLDQYGDVLRPIYTFIIIDGVCVRWDK
jgi:branched-chain amino acid transport system substrate-binding protein